MTTKRDYYDVLGVPRSAGAEDIKRAFRKLAMEYHPDRNPASDAAERFKEVSEAYEILSDSERRARYDQYGHAATQEGAGQGFSGFSGFGGFGDIFDAFFGNGGRRRGPQRGADIRATLTIDFEDAVFGAEKEIELQRTEVCSECRGTGAAPGSQPEVCDVCRGTGEVRRTQQSLFGQFVNVTACERCRGSGRIVSNPCKQCKGAGQERRRRTMVVKIPAGVDDGSQIRLTGEGEAGSQGGSPGSLYLQLNVRPHKFFRRDGNDLIYELAINIAQAALGAELTVPLLDGETTTVKVPPGTQSGHLIRIRDQGVPYLRRGGRGDLLVLVYVVTPTKLSAAQKKLIEQLAESLPKEEHAGAEGGFIHRMSGSGDDRGFFDRIRDAFAS